MAHRWPGNLRELHRVIQVAVLFTDEEALREEDVEFDHHVHSKGVSSRPLTKSEPDEEDMSLDSAVLEHIAKVYEFTGNNKSKTAKLLGVSRSTLDRKLEELK